jgi:hypothetical protein
VNEVNNRERNHCDNRSQFHCFILVILVGELSSLRVTSIIEGIVEKIGEAPGVGSEDHVVYQFAKYRDRPNRTPDFGYLVIEE